MAAKLMNLNSLTDQVLFQLYRIAAYITFNVIDDAAMLAFALS